MSLIGFASLAASLAALLLVIPGLPDPGLGSCSLSQCSCLQSDRIGSQGFDFGLGALGALRSYIFVAAVDVSFIVGMQAASRRH